MSDLIFFANAQAFRIWLQANSATAADLVVGFHKVGSGRTSMSWSESVDEALCFGWIDGVRKRIDEHAYQIRFTPRKATSTWSTVNIARMQALRAAGRMTGAGEAAFARRTEKRSAIYAYERQQVAELSRQQTQAFKRHAAAWQYFERCPPGYRQVLLHWVVSAKRAETQASRLRTLIQACADGKRLR